LLEITLIPGELTDPIVLMDGEMMMLVELVPVVLETTVMDLM
tara:strand:+ start:150 stop:275 length:126 start_codon:yes stop_codon:yes gene_type:complete